MNPLILVILILTKNHNRSHNILKQRFLGRAYAIAHNYPNFRRFLRSASLSPTFYYHLFLIIDSGMNADFLSESGCPGFEDVQDVIALIAHLFVGG